MLQYQAKAAFDNSDYSNAAQFYRLMDSVYGHIVDYKDMKNFCIAAAMCSDTNSVHHTLLALTEHKCFDIRFLENPIFSFYKEKE